MLIWLITVWVLYFIHHSVFASKKVKSFLSREGLNLRIQRLLYNAIAIVGLIPIGIMISTDGNYLYSPSLLIKLAGGLLLMTGMGLSFYSFKNYDIKGFLGLRKVDKLDLKKNGILSFVRHPLYTGLILATIGALVSNPKISIFASSIMIFMYLPVGIYFEESKLIGEFGDEYLNYKKKVGAILPKWKRK